MVQRRNWEHNVLPLGLVIAGLILMVISFILTTTRTTTQSGMWMDQMPSTMTAYTATNLLIAIIGAFMFTSGLMYLLFRQEYEPLPQSAIPTIPSTPSTSAIGAPGRVLSEPDILSSSQARTTPSVSDQPASTGLRAAAEGSIAPVPDNGHQSTYYLTLRLLSGDERSMFKALMDSGGEALQKDLMPRTKMSDAKVSRVIDRLEEKGVVSKLRYGMTNKVRIEIET